MGSVLRREWRRVRATPRLWYLCLVIPILLSGLLLAIFVERTPHRMPVTVLDYDGSSLSKRLIQALDAAPGLKVSTLPADLEQAAVLMRRGEIYAAVALPPGLERDVAQGRSPRVQLFYNRQMMTAGNIAARDVQTALGTVSAGLGLASGTPPAIMVETHPLFNPGLDYSRFLALPLIISVLHILIVVVAIDVTGRELREHTAGDWLASANDRVIVALAGKLLPYGLWFVALGAGIAGLCTRLLGLEIAGSIMLWLIGWAGLVFACMGLGTFLVGVFGNLRLATSIASLIVSPAFAYSGLTFPALAMSGFAAVWTWLLPLSHFLHLHTGQLAMAAPPAAALIQLAGLMAFALLPLLVLNRWRHWLRAPDTWGAI